MKLFVLIISFLFLNCAKTESSLSFSIVPDTSFVISGDAKDGCYTDDANVDGDDRPDISGPRIHFPNSKIVYSGKEQLFIVNISIKIKKKPGLSDDITCDIGGDDLDLLYGFTNGYFGNPGTVNSKCAIKCSALPLDDTSTKGFQLQGEAKLIGYSISNDVQTPISATTSVTIQKVAD